MNTPHPVIIDCDPGIDDALALMLAAASPELDLRAVTCVAGNRPVPTTADNACRILDVAGRPEVPVHAGCARPLAQAEARCNLVHGADGLGGVALPQHRRPAPQHAVDVIEQALLGAPPGRITLVALGPLTNLALAEIKHPGLLRRARALLIMGGAAFCPGNITPSAEFNFHADPLAAHVVMGAGATVKLFGLDVTSRAVVPGAWIGALARLGSPCGRAAHAMMAAYALQDPLLHDPCPVAWLLDPTLFTSQPCTVSVDWRPGLAEGHVSAWPAGRDDKPGPPNADVFTEVRCAPLLELVHQRLASLR